MREVATDAYVEEVRRGLGTLPARERDDAVAELKALLAETVASRGEAAALESMGPAADYAASVVAALRDDDEALRPQGRVLGMPYDFRGPSSERIAARVWNPADPRILTPRLFGVGWTLNLGAVAVKLGLLRPDDADDASFERMPAGAARAAVALPGVLAAAIILLVAVAWHAMPAEVPVHWGLSGAPDGWSPKADAFGILGALGVVPVLLVYIGILRPGISARVRVLWSAVVTLLAGLGLGVTILTVLDARGGSSGNWSWLVILGALVLSFLDLLVPVRLAVRAERDGSLNRPKSGGMK